MKQAILILGIFTAVFFTVGNNKAHTNGSGAPEGNVGSLTSSCGGYCHGNGSVPITDQSLTMSVSYFEEEGNYTIWVNAQGSEPQQYQKVGFQACIENTQGDIIGDLVVTDSDYTKIVGQDYITHTSAGTASSPFVFGSHQAWEFKWVPPAEFQGEAILYVASIFSNNDGTNGGDTYVGANQSFNVGVGIDAVNDFEFTAFPNPTTEQITLQWKENPGENANIYLCDSKGAISTLIKGDLNQNEYTFSIPSHLARGMYTLNVVSKKGQSSKRIVLQ